MGTFHIALRLHSGEPVKLTATAHTEQEVRDLLDEHYQEGYRVAFIGLPNPDKVI